MRALPFFVACVLATGCFEPQYVDGGLKCATGGLCPEGMACYSGACWTHAPVVSVDAAAPDTISAADALVEALPTVRYLDQPCDPINAGTAARSDNCAGGLVCVDGNTGATCMRRCSSNAECGDAACEPRSPDTSQATVALVCGPPTATCDPVAYTGCPAGRTCYLSGARTVCETSSGDGQQTSCIYSRDCLPGYACAAAGPGAGRCLAVCLSSSPTCPGISNCHSAQGYVYGYCY